MLGVACNLIFREKYCSNMLQIITISVNLCYVTISVLKRVSYSAVLEEMSDLHTNVEERSKLATLTIVRPKRWTTFLLRHFHSPLFLYLSLYFALSARLLVSFFNLLVHLLASEHLVLSISLSALFFLIWHFLSICVYSFLFLAFNLVGNCKYRYVFYWVL